MSFTLALVGRPNVGKSTLFNRLVGKKLALVDDRPGVTRDRREGEAKLADLRFTVVDTAGLEESKEGSLIARMREQTEYAIKTADCVLFLIDARAGVTPDDNFFAEIARRTNVPVIIGANKAEGKVALPGILDAFSLGFGDPIPLSGEHGEGMADLYDALRPLVDFKEEQEEAEKNKDEDQNGEDEEIDGDLSTRSLRIAVMGRPNAGKSTLINNMIGEDRLLTGPEAGITRDSIGINWVWQDRKIKIFDTAGLRRRSRIEEKLEKLAVADALRAVRFAEVVIVLIDATVPFEKQDLTLIDLCEREGRAIVVALNKWDLIEKRGATLSILREEFERLLPQIKGCQLVPISGLVGKGLDDLMKAVAKTYAVWNERVPTSKINRWLSGVTQNHPPPAVSGRRIKLRYATQVKSRPPSFALFGNQLDSLPENYKRYLVNSLREVFDLPGVPLRLSFRTSENPYGTKDR